MVDRKTLSIFSTALHDAVKTPAQKQKEEDAWRGWYVVSDYFEGVTGPDAKLTILQEREPELVRHYQARKFYGLRPVDFAVLRDGTNNLLVYLETLRNPEADDSSYHVGFIEMENGDYQQYELHAHARADGPAERVEIVKGKHGLARIRILDADGLKLNDLEFSLENFGDQKELERAIERMRNDPKYASLLKNDDAEPAPGA